MAMISGRGALAGGAETQAGCVVVAGPAGPFLVRNAFYTAYQSPGERAALGAPLEEEHWEGPWVVQRFERGALTWTPEGSVVASGPGAAWE